MSLYLGVFHEQDFHSITTGMLASRCLLYNVTTRNCVSNELESHLRDRARDRPGENGGKVVSFEWQSAASWARQPSAPKLCSHDRRVLHARRVGPSSTGS